MVQALNRLHPTPFTRFLATQLEHADWAGFHFYDLIFPLFLFIVGVSIVLSMDRLLATSAQGWWVRGEVAVCCCLASASSITAV